MAASRTSVTLDPIACCAPVTGAPMDPEQAELMAASFAALADPIRLRLFGYVASAAGDEVCACDLPAVVDRSQPTISHHMKVLVDAGLIHRDKRGLWVWYRLNSSRLDVLRGVLA